jgi:hypothetical protein
MRRGHQDVKEDAPSRQCPVSLPLESQYVTAVASRVDHLTVDNAWKPAPRPGASLSPAWGRREALPKKGLTYGVDEG